MSVRVEFTLTYEGKQTSALDNKIGPLVRKYNGRWTTTFNYADNETVIVITLDNKKDKDPFQKELSDPKYSFLTLEGVVVASVMDD